MKITYETESGKTYDLHSIRSISVTAESENIMEFIHIFDRNGKRLGMLSIYNKHSGKTEVEYDVIKEV